jgi:hypothetical protein
MESLDDFQRAEAQLRTTTLSRSHEEYIAQHVELRELLHDVLQAVLVHKPADPIAFIQSHATKLKPAWAGIDETFAGQAAKPPGGH